MKKKTDRKETEGTQNKKFYKWTLCKVRWGLQKALEKLKIKTDRQTDGQTLESPLSSSINMDITALSPFEIHSNQI